ncbi:hypothetical protein DPMN_025688 [Dreissena polymorpha]|uniref:Uncharacterized protein n=1 Tax=Dreissena polymorpha TaxID=45954 RepID=A0A9D4LRX8_DREPO|nr:hypothetical protein DPMN_025688 [Dreissena polymorpha]
MWVFAVRVKSSMKSITNRTTEIVHPVTMPFSKLCHAVVLSPTAKSSLMPL